MWKVGHLEQDDRINRFIAIVTVTMGDFVAHKTEIYRLGHAAQRMIRAYALIEVDRIVEQFGLGLVDAHHSCLSDIPAVHSFKQHRKIVIWATRP